MCVRVKRVGKDAPKPLPHPGVPADGACVLISDPAHMTVKDLEAKLIELFYSPQAVSESKGKSSSSSSSKDRSKPLTKDVLTAFDPTLRSLRIWLRDGNDWRCLLLDDFGKTLEQVDIQQEDVLLVELERARKSGSSAPPSWYMDRRSIPRRWDQFHVGDSIDARDKQAIWYASVVKSVAGQPGALATDTAGTLRVHFVGWDEKW
jgi:hypothetical protein